MKCFHIYAAGLSLHTSAYHPITGTQQETQQNYNSTLCRTTRANASPSLYSASQVSIFEMHTQTRHFSHFETVTLMLESGASEYPQLSHLGKTHNAN